MNIVDVINNITNFSSSIWQIHPFREGNTRPTELFIENNLVSLRLMQIILYLNIKEDNSFLIKFYENLLLGKNNNLHSRDLIVEELF